MANKVGAASGMLLMSIVSIGSRSFGPSIETVSLVRSIVAPIRSHNVRKFMSPWFDSCPRFVIVTLDPCRVANAAW